MLKEKVFLKRHSRAVLIASLFLLLCLACLLWYLYSHRRQEQADRLGEISPKAVDLQYNLTEGGKTVQYYLSTDDAAAMQTFVELINSYSFGKEHKGSAWRPAPEGLNLGGVFICHFFLPNEDCYSIVMNPYFRKTISFLEHGKDRYQNLPVYFAPKEQSDAMESKFWVEMDAFVKEAAQSGKWEVKLLPPTPGSAL